jgi:glycosyltransferase involved in cell wall biosynthesis
MQRLTTVIPVYNGERYLKKTLSSVAEQTRLPDRVIVLDNCSTDSTEEIVGNFSGLHCEWRRHESNIGLLGNLNCALGLASETDYLHLLMADDLILPTFYEKVLGALSLADGRSLAYSFNDEIDQAGATVGPSSRRPSGPARVIRRKDYLARQAELLTVLLPAVVFKTQRLPAPCLFQDLPQVSDTLFLAEWAMHCQEIIELPEYLCQYRLHPFNATRLNLQNITSWVSDEWKVIQTILPWIEEPWPVHWLREQKLKCLFSARSQVKVDLMAAAQPEYAQQINLMVRKTVHPLHYCMGKCAVRIRDFLDGIRRRPTTTERLRSAIVAPSQAGGHSQT